MTPPKPPRPQTHHGDRNENRSRVYTSPLGTVTIGDEPAAPAELAVPHEVPTQDTDVTTIPSPELLERRAKRTTDEKIERVLDYQRTAERYRHERELLEAKERAAARRGRFIVAVITALGGAIAAIIAAVH